MPQQLPLPTTIMMQSMPSLATVSDADGAIASAVLANGTSLPAGMALNALTGEVTVSDATLLVANTYTFDVTTVDAVGGVTTQTVTITIGADIEAVYAVEPAQNVDSYTNGETLATVTDADGGIVSATVTSGTLPAGTMVDTVTGEITVADESALIAGTYSFDVTTEDAEGGVTTQTVSLTFDADTEAVYAVEPAKNLNDYLDGDSLATVTDADGDIVAVELINGSALPDGMEMDYNSGTVKVSDYTQLIPGNYSVELKTTDEKGGETIHSITILINDSAILVISCASDIEKFNDKGECSAVVDVVVPSVNRDDLTVTGQRSDGLGLNEPYPLGTTTITWTATDDKGNSEECVQIVNVIDNELPEVTAPNNVLVSGYSDIEGQNYVDISISDAVYSDNCSGSLTWTMTGAAVDNGFGQVGTYQFPFGETIITYTNTDNAGWTATDSTKVTIISGENLVVYTNTSLSGNIFDNDVFDSLRDSLLIDTNSINGPFNGDIDIDENGDFTYTPHIGFYGDDKVTVLICSSSKEMLTCANYIMYFSVVDNISVFAGTDTSICEGVVLELVNAVASDTSIVWQTSGDGTFDDSSMLHATYIPGINDVEEGEVMLTLTSLGCEQCENSRDTFFLSILRKPLANAGPDLTACPGNEVYIENAFAENYSEISWSSNGQGHLMGEYSLTPSYLPAENEEGVVKLVMYAKGNENCEFSATDTLLIDYGIKIFVDALDNDTVFYESSALLYADVYPQDGNYSFSWNPADYLMNPNSESTETIELLSDQEFVVTVTDNQTGCSASDSVQIVVETSIDEFLIIRNGVSPNGDGNNDIWWIEGIENFPDNNVKIFNRWGDEIIDFRSYDNDFNSWNGSNRRGEIVPNGTYYYILEIKDIKTFTGWIQVRTNN